MADDKKPSAGNGGAGADGKGDGSGAGGGDKPPVIEAPKWPFRGIVFVAEVVGCGNHRIPSTNVTLRAKWNPGGNMPKHAIRDQFAGMPSEIPGQFVGYNGTRKIIDIVDPMGQPENEAKMKNLARVIQAGAGAASGEKVGPAADIQVILNNEQTAKEWLYWLRRLYDAGFLELKAGTIPSIPEIERLPGRIRYNAGDRNAVRAESAESGPPLPYTQRQGGKLNDPTDLIATTAGTLERLLKTAGG